MVIDHAGGLHEGVDRRWTAKSKSFLLQRFGHCGARWCLPRNVLHAFDRILLRYSVNEIPQECRQAHTFAKSQIGLRIIDRGLDLATVANDPGILQQALNLFLVVTCDFFSVKIIKDLTEARPLVEDRDP